MSKKILLYRGKKNESVREATRTIRGWAEKSGFSLREITTQDDITREENSAEGEIVLLSLGGDGSFLRAADLIAPFRIPILGINLGKLGFLTGLDDSNLKESLERVFRGGFSVKELSRLRCSLDLENDKETASEYSPVYAINHLGSESLEDAGSYSTGERRTLVGTYDGETYELYIDGQKIDSATGGDDVEMGELIIGADAPSGSYQEFDGQIHEIRLYHTAFDEQGIESVSKVME